MLQASAPPPISNMHDEYDPLAEAIKPPQNESETQREARLKEEAEATRISKEIDARIAEENRIHEWRKRALKILLLGQAESGKSTVLKSMFRPFSLVSTQRLTHSTPLSPDFQLLYSPKWFHAEREAWRAIIQLNLIK
jgi:hypothetical protein